MKRICIGLLVLFLFFSGTALAGTVETPEPMTINSTIVLADYGYAAAGDDGWVNDHYGYVLEEDEERDADSKDPCMYVALKNVGDEGKSVKIYLRSTSKSKLYWSKRVFIPAGETEYEYFIDSGKKNRAVSYAGGWSLDLTGKNGLVRFTLE